MAEPAPTIIPPDPAQQLRALYEQTRTPDPKFVAELAKTYKDRTGTERVLKLDYVGHADATALLLDHDPTWDWEPPSRDELDRLGVPTALVVDHGSPIGLWIALTVHGKRRLGYGSCTPGKPDAVKELIGDAIRNASMRFGVALSLWSKAEWAEVGHDHNGATPTPKAPTPPTTTRRAPDTTPPATAAPQATDLPQQAGRLIAAAAKKAGFTAPTGGDQATKDDIDKARRDVLQAVTGQRTSKDLTRAEQVDAAIDAFTRIANGDAVLAYMPDGTPYLREEPF